jgi:hypothetical protein
MHAVYVVNAYSVDIGFPMMMLIGDRVGMTSANSNPPRFRRS